MLSHISILIFYVINLRKGKEFMNKYISNVDLIQVASLSFIISDSTVGNTYFLALKIDRE